MGVRGGDFDRAECVGAGDGGARVDLLPVRVAHHHRGHIDPHVQQRVPRQQSQRALQCAEREVEWASSHDRLSGSAHHGEHLPEGPTLGLHPQLPQLVKQLKLV